MAHLVHPTDLMNSVDTWCRNEIDLLKGPVAGRPPHWQPRVNASSARLGERERVRPSSRPCALVVDDELQVREVLRDYFAEILGYEVIVADTAVGGLAAARAGRPDVVLLDLNMPGVVDGSAVVKAIAAEAPVVIISAVHSVEIARRTLQDGAFDFVMKPFTLSRVGEMADLAIAHSHGARR
jgi:FixJ family two-component response regulator